MNAAESIAERIREGILSGSYRPGERLPAEREMAERLGVNRGSVREALRTLEQQGLVSTRRGGGTTVRPLEEASLEIVRHLVRSSKGRRRDALGQLLDVHEMLVAGAARLAVERGGDEDLHAARALLAELPRSEAGARRSALFDELVEVITRASGNLVLHLCRNGLRPALADELPGLVARHRLRREVLEAHVEKIDAALAARDPAATEEAVRGLLRARRERLLRAPEATAADDRVTPECGPAPA